MTKQAKLPNSQGQIMYMSIIPIAIILMILTGAGFFLFKDDFELPKLRKEATEIDRLEGFPTVVENSNQIDKQRHVIKSEAELAEFLNTVDPSGKLTVKKDINFKNTYLLAVSTPTNDTYGYELRIKKVENIEKDNEFKVHIIETRPEDSCDEDKVPNVALDIVSISKTDKIISFELTKEVTRCESDEEEAEDAAVLEVGGTQGDGTEENGAGTRDDTNTE